MAKDMNEMSRAEFLALPHREWNEEIVCDAVVIIPTGRKHDSGYGAMDYAAVIEGEPKLLLAGGSDVVHIEGIGGYGDNWLEKYGGLPQSVPPTGWNIDCLRKSRLLRLFARGRIKCGPALSSFEVYSLPPEEETP